jgi:hypothetical protein
MCAAGYAGYRYGYCTYADDFGDAFVSGLCLTACWIVLFLCGTRGIWPGQITLLYIVPPPALLVGVWLGFDPHRYRPY